MVFIIELVMISQYFFDQWQILGWLILVCIQRVCFSKQRALRFFNKAFGIEGDEHLHYPDVIRSVLTQLKQQKALNPVNLVACGYDADDFEIEETVTIQAEIVSTTLKTSWHHNMPHWRWYKHLRCCSRMWDNPISPWWHDLKRQYRFIKFASSRIHVHKSSARNSMEPSVDLSIPKHSVQSLKRTCWKTSG